MKKLKLAAFAAMAAVSASGPALAATATANLGVSITLQNQCKVTGGAINFGSSVGLIDTGNIDQNGTFTVQCSKGTSYWVGLDGGGAGSTTARVMKGPSPSTAETIGYSLSQDAAGGTNWGNTAATSPASTTAANSSPKTFTVYGRVPAQATPSAGTYNDTVLITVNY